MNRFTSRPVGGEVIKTIAGLAVIGQAVIQMGAIPSRLQLGKQRGYRRSDITDETQIKPRSPPQVLRANVDLRNL